MHTRRLILLYALAAWIAFVAIRVEILNKAAGSILPLGEVMAKNRADGGSGKWRARHMTEEWWRKTRIVNSEGEPDPRPLTAAETEQMTQEVTRANTSADLHDFLNYYGWALQYIAVCVLLLLVVSCIVEMRPRRGLLILYLIPSLVAIAGGVLAVRREYFSSLAGGI